MKKESFLIMVNSFLMLEVMFVKHNSLSVSHSSNSLTFMRELAEVYTDYDAACRIAHALETSGDYNYGTHFYVVKNTNLW